MRFNCGESAAKRINRIQNWHCWFAWHPVQVAEHDCRWLETVERKGTFVDMLPLSSFWKWQYRPRDFPLAYDTKAG